MQRVVQRTQRAIRQANRKHAKSKALEAGDESFTRLQQRKRMQAELARTHKDSKINRRQDWEAGPLAPRRDVGDQKDSYGTVSMYNFRSPELDPRDRPSWWYIREGDRVVVTRGRDRGKIGVVDFISKERGRLGVKGVGEVLVNFPEWMVMEEERGLQDTVQPMHRDMKLEDVRLVYALPDPDTGIPRDVVIDRLVRGPRIIDSEGNPEEHAPRVVAGTNIIIPWPETADEVHVENECDTPEDDVRVPTWRPSLIYTPFPASVIDELRNKYSKFRTRHDWEYTIRKEAEDANSEKRKELGRRMRTPLQELADVRTQQKREAKRDLTEQQLEAIGAVIAQQQTRVSTTAASSS
ncbi:Hypothetical protein R9X50_00384100 [Acrodontium crateriforme]|uniref:KOW domain-containing protein n=1 Tax=Acrodontium crateriforme TaxID=150365 RepID=A0AAQ3M9W2_9PEZI|nr:Hypothetical protein R9X50_00384100 [Acrodontium crateriforme]